MRNALRVAVAISAAMFAFSLILGNTVYGGGREVPEALWGLLVPFGLFTCGAVAVVGLGVLMATRPRTGENMKLNWWLVAFGILLAFGATFLVVGSEFSVATLLVLLGELGVAALIIGAATLIGRRRRGAEYDYGSRHIRWWWILAGLIGVTEIVAIAAQLVREPKATNLLAFLIVGTFGASVLAGLAIQNRRSGNIMIAIGVLPVMALFWSVIPPIVALLVIVMALAENVRLSGLRRERL